ncbi:NADH:flavin oxidoreductase/NADH oxidase [Humitalea sp. 24SJ18S-53]|uniref:NADH:flavin oxidoreductase/NADH oxidase n=1 Tax=Humitalea sp. 24SJ18S-53 TaxID=3422307 RepID=UPI003D66E9E0
MTDLFAPLDLAGGTSRNRIGMSPMCQYCAADDGRVTDWHMAHLLQRAVGGAGLVITEVAAITRDGRITPGDLGFWEDSQFDGHARLAAAIAHAGALPGIQIGHAGRKASRGAPWNDGPAVPSWPTLSASPVPMGNFAVPAAMTVAEIEGVIEAFAETAARAARAGYRIIELHGAHGYLLHQFLSPLSNHRDDAWGGDFAGRTRLLLEATRAVKAVLPADVSLWVRISHTDWIEGGWTTDDTIRVSALLKDLGVEAMDVSSGGIDPSQRIPVGPGYQVPGGRAVRQATGMLTASVGMITEPAQAAAIVADGDADMVLLARALLRDPYWPLRAAAALGRLDAITVAPQYERGWNALGRIAMDRAAAEAMPPV